MTSELMSRFSECLDQVEKDPTIRSVVITSVEGHFCAGAELTKGLPGEPSALGGPVGVPDRLRQLYAPFLRLLDFPIPTIAAVRGAAVGGGLGLAMACDFRVVTPKTRFKAPFVHLGIHPGMALTYLLPLYIGLSRAQEMLVLGQEVRGEQALSWGLATRCVADDVLQQEAAQLAAQAASGAPAVVRWTKRAVQRAVKLDPRLAIEVESLAQAITFSSADAQEGMRAFFEKRSPDFKGE